jgi:hypothetical protein
LSAAFGWLSLGRRSRGGAVGLRLLFGVLFHGGRGNGYARSWLGVCFLLPSTLQARLLTFSFGLGFGHRKASG